MACDMAIVSAVIPDDREFKSAHASETKCKYMVGETDGKKMIQLNSYGSKKRKIPGKLSQTLQFNEQTAKQLFEVLKKEFGFQKD